MKVKNIAILAFITLFIVIFVNQVTTINVKDFPLQIQYDGKLGKGNNGKSVDDGIYTFIL